MLLTNTNRRHFTRQPEGHVDVAKVLIQNDIDVNAVQEDKETALHLRISVVDMFDV